jgi:hypothetical protein
MPGHDNGEIVHSSAGRDPDSLCYRETAAYGSRGSLTLVRDDRCRHPRLPVICRPRQWARARRGPMINSGGDPYSVTYRETVAYGSRASLALARDDSRGLPQRIRAADRWLNQLFEK